MSIKLYGLLKRPKKQNLQRQALLEPYFHAVRDHSSSNRDLGQALGDTYIYGDYRERHALAVSPSSDMLET